MDLSFILPTAEPFLFPGDRIGCLLIHGLTGTPKEMRWMGEYLSQRAGHTVLGVRLAGHATNPKDLEATHWEEWLASVEDGWHLLNSFCQDVYVMGLSLGGVLALTFAAHHPVKGVVAMSTPYELPPDPRLPYLRLLSRIVPHLDKGPDDWHNPDAASDHVDYPYFPTRALVELAGLLDNMRAGLSEIQAPVLLIHSKEDKTVAPENMQKIYDHLLISQKQMLWVEDSGHVITREPQRERVFQAASEFIRRTQNQFNNRLS